jgi:hypothetical protein
MSKPTDLVQGTVDLLILKTITPGPMHGWAIAQRIKQVSNDVLILNQNVRLQVHSHRPSNARLWPDLGQTNIPLGPLH